MQCVLRPLRYRERSAHIDVSGIIRRAPEKGHTIEVFVVRLDEWSSFFCDVRPERRRIGIPFLYLLPHGFNPWARILIPPRRRPSAVVERNELLEGNRVLRLGITLVCHFNCILAAAFGHECNRRRTFRGGRDEWAEECAV